MFFKLTEAGAITRIKGSVGRFRAKPRFEIWWSIYVDIGKDIYTNDLCVVESDLATS
jgi:hypothetical protein